MTDALESLYSADELKAVLGNSYIGPDILPHGQQVRIAKFKAEQADGQDVEICATFCPADFYSIKAIEGKNSVGNAQKAFTLSTGSDMLKWAVETAKHISEGMIGID